MVPILGTKSPIITGAISVFRNEHVLETHYMYIYEYNESIEIGSLILLFGWMSLYGLASSCLHHLESLSVVFTVVSTCAGDASKTREHHSSYNSCD